MCISLEYMTVHDSLRVYYYYLGTMLRGHEKYMEKKIKHFKFDIPDAFIKKYQLELILLFGSYSEGSASPESDIDIALYSRRIISETEKIDLTYEFGNILGTEDIDLVDMKTASPLLKKRIFDNYIVLFQSDPMLLYQLELVNLYELKETEILYQIRRERLLEFVR